MINSPPPLRPPLQKPQPAGKTHARIPAANFGPSPKSALQPAPPAANEFAPTVPTVRVLRYHAATRVDVQAFVDVAIGAIRVNGVHLLRNGNLGAARLTPLISGRRAFIPAIEILDPKLQDLLSAAIVTAIRRHMETLPPDQRVKPPRPNQPRQGDQQPPAAAASEKPSPPNPTTQLQNAPVAKPATTAWLAVPTRPEAIETVDARVTAEKPKLRPPMRPIASFPRRPL